MMLHEAIQPSVRYIIYREKYMHCMTGVNSIVVIESLKNVLQHYLKREALKRISRTVT